MDDDGKKLKTSLSDYCVITDSDKKRLSNFERLTLIGGAELEKAVSWFAKQLTRFTYLDQFGQFDVEQLKFAAQMYDVPELRAHPEQYYSAPKRVTLVEQHEIHGLSEGTICDLQFLSSYQAQHAPLVDRYYSYQENRTVHARWWKHSVRKRPLIIAVHGWTMGDQRINSLAFQPGYFFRLGFDVLLFELPFHGRRAPKGRSAETTIFPSTDFIITNEAIAQAISDLRDLRLYLNSQDSTAIGVLGMSLGAYVASLWSSLDNLDFCIPIVPLVSMADMAWKIVENSPQAALYISQGVNRQLFDSVYHLHCPLNFAPNIDNNKLMIIAGLSDAIVPPEQPKMLWQHWRNPHIFWFEGGHVAEAGKSRAFPEIAKFFRGLGLVPKGLT